MQLTNVVLKSDGFPDRFPCTVTETRITCTDIPDSYGSFTDEPRTLNIAGDITTPDPAFASLQISLGDPGYPDTPGSVSWSDGSVEFDWVALPSPVARGTVWE